MNFMEEIQKLTEEFNAKIEELTKHIKEQEEEVSDRMPKGEIWKPKNNEKYWAYYYDLQDVAFDEYGTSIGAEDEQKELDLISRGLVYPTQEKAEFEAQREKYTRLFRQYVEQHSEPLDWKNNGQKKWFMYFDYTDNSVGFNWRCACEDAGCIYASSEDVLQEAIEFVGKENMKRYIFCVEE